MIHIQIILPPVWSGVYLNVARLMQSQWQDADYSVVVNELGAADAHALLTVVLGWHLLAPNIEIPRPYVLYQLEPLQLFHWRQKMQANMHLFQQASAVWDYSPDNLFFYADLKVSVSVKPMGFHPKMIEARHQPYPDIDVLFVGFVTERRRLILEALMEFCCVSVQPRWGHDFVEALGRSKILLNLHQHDISMPLEQPRVAYALNNRVYVVTEPSTDQPYPDLPYVSQTSIVDQVMELLHHPRQRVELANEIHRAFRSYNYQFALDGHL